MKLRSYALGILFAAALPASVRAAELVKGSASAVYYVDGGRRYVFPNEKVYRSWYPDFSSVRSISDGELASYQIGGNVTYKPGSRLVKVQSDPRVYAIGRGGLLRWIGSEEAARILYGDGWRAQVDDIPDSFFFSYHPGVPISSAGDFNRNGESSSEMSISDDLSVRSASGTDAEPALQEVKALKVGAWSDPAVWGGAPPGAGAQVMIPSNVSVTYDLSDGPSLESLHILGTLRFSSDLSTRLSARHIDVRGALRIGSAEAPLPADRKAEIALTGVGGNDGLTVDGGLFSLHGADIGAAWSRLAASAEKGATAIVLERPLNWPVGGEIAIFNAASDAAPETRVIAAVDGAKVVFDQPLADGHTSDTGLRSEAVLLTRNIVISGAGSGEGASVRALNRAEVDIDGVAFQKLGRKGLADRHPLVLDGLDGGVVRRSVFRTSGNRCLVLRQTTGATIEGNAAVDAYGSCFVTAEGSETDNTFRTNLAAYILAGALAEDAVPAAFLIKNPDNTLEGNEALASDGFGYWYRLPEHAVGRNGTALSPRQTALGGFNGNLARGNRRTGLYVDDNDTGQINYAPDRKAVFSGLTAVRNGEHGFWIRGSNIEVAGSYLAGNAIGGTFAAFGATFRDSTVVGRLDHAAATLPVRYGFTYFDGPVIVQDVRFAHFTGASAALGFEEKDPVLPDPRNSLRGATFEDARPWRFLDPVTPGDRMAVVRDLDHEDAIGAGPGFLGSDCVPDKDLGAARCAAGYAQLLVALRDAPGNQNVAFTNLTNGAAVTLTPGSAFDGRYAYATVAEGGTYRATVPGAAPLRIEYDGTSEPLTVRVPAGVGAQVTSDGVSVSKKTLSDLMPGSWASDVDTGEAVLWLNPGDAFELTR